MDIGRARRFYEDTLGLTPAEESERGLTYRCGGGSAFFLYPSAVPSRGGHTQIGIEVPDLNAAMAGLRARGVAFEEYEGITTENGVASEPGGPRGAWFTDSEGNLVGVVQL
jgi:catechol 2,3-dioxygenase-like lactoylglutathione lyase family enzyme